MDIYNNEQLIKQLDQGEQFKYLYFWGHRNSGSHVTKSCFSQWFEASFEIDGQHFLTAEHYMMYGKAMLFNDKESAEKILTATSPGAVKAIGREVKNFDNETWLAHRFDIVVAGNLAKFNNNPTLREFLLGTKDRILVEASPVDKIWGIGLAQDNHATADPRQWQGLNLLGYALMKVRHTLRTKN